jgi:hypothetical protein
MTTTPLVRRFLRSVGTSLLTSCPPNGSIPCGGVPTGRYAGRFRFSAPIDSLDQSVQAGFEAVNVRRRQAVPGVIFVGLPGSGNKLSSSVMTHR